jgi:hypothetical protein
MAKFVNDLRQVGGFRRVLRFLHHTNKPDRHDIAEIVLNVALNTFSNKPNAHCQFRGVCQGMKRTYLYMCYPLFQAQWDRCDQRNHQT